MSRAPAPDGYTLLMAATGFVVNPSLYEKVQYDPLKDFDQVAEITTFPVIYTVRPDMGVNTLQELIAYAKARPGALNYSTPGAGTLPHLAAELLKLHTGIDMVHIPYAGAAPAAQALLEQDRRHGLDLDLRRQAADRCRHLQGPRGQRQRALAGTAERPDRRRSRRPGGTRRHLARASWCRPARRRTSIDRLAKALIEVMRRPDVRERLLRAGFHCDRTRAGETSASALSKKCRSGKNVIQKARISAQ